MYYTTDRKYQTSGFKYFVKSELEREPLMLDKQTIDVLSYSIASGIPVTLTRVKC